MNKPVPPPVSATLPGRAGPVNKKAWSNAVDFEAQFLKSMLEQAYAGLTGEGPLGSSGPGGEAWRSFLIDEQAKQMAQKGGIGLAATVYRDIIRNLGTKS